MDQFLMSLPMLIFHLTWLSLCINDAIIHEDGEPSFLDLPSKYGVHHHLKSCWGIGEPKKHYHWFE
jgi:hypothetical protein